MPANYLGGLLLFPGCAYDRDRGVVCRQFLNRLHAETAVVAADAVMFGYIFLGYIMGG